MTKKFTALAASLTLVQSCGDVTQLADEQDSQYNWQRYENKEDSINSGEIEALRAITRKSNWLLNEKRLADDNAVSTDYCISWDFEPPTYISISTYGQMVLLYENKEDRQTYGYLSDCSDNLIEYKLYFEEKSNRKRHLISTVTRVTDSEPEESLSPQAASKTYQPASSATPTWTPQPTPRPTAAPTSARVVFSLYSGTMRYKKSCTYDTRSMGERLCLGSCSKFDFLTKEIWERELKFKYFAEVQAKYGCTLTLVGGKYLCDIVNSSNPFSTCTFSFSNYEQSCIERRSFNDRGTEYKNIYCYNSSIGGYY